MPGNLKVAFDFDDKEGTVMLTVAEDDCDPAYEVLSSLDLPQALEKIPDFVQAARDKWEMEPRYVKYKKPRAKKAEAPAASPTEEAAAQSAPPSESEAPLEEADAYVYKVPEGIKPVNAGDLPLLGQPSESEPASPETEDTGPTETEEPAALSQPSEMEPALRETGDTGLAKVEEPPAEAPPPEEQQPSNGGSGKWVYKVYRREGEIMLLSGGHPPEDAEDDSWTCSTYSNTHDALRDLGVTQEEIDKHKYWHRWDRLPRSHQLRIEKVSV